MTFYYVKLLFKNNKIISKFQNYKTLGGFKNDDLSLQFNNFLT